MTPLSSLQLKIRASFLVGIVLLSCLYHALLPFSSQAQFLEKGARTPALGGAGIGLMSEEWGSRNPAAWAMIQRRTFSFFAGQAFGLSELRVGAFQFLQPVPKGAAVLSLRSFGFDAYRENEAGIGYARLFYLGSLRSISLGMSANWKHVSLGKYGAASTLGLTLGLAFALSQHLSAGFQAKNINTPKLKQKEPLEKTVGLGFAFRPSASLVFVADLIKSLEFPPSLHGGVEWKPVPSVVLRNGISSRPVRVTLGIGLVLRHISCDLVLERHELLGWSPGAGLSVY